MTAEADFSLSASLDSMAGWRPGAGEDGPADLRRVTRRVAAECWPVNTVAPQWNGLGTYDVPQVFGPKDGYAWVVSMVTAASFTAGTVNMYRGLPADNNLKCAFTAAGSFLPGGKGMILLPGDRLTFAAAASAPVTGPVTLSLDAIQVATDLLPGFLA